MVVVFFLVAGFSSEASSGLALAVEAFLVVFLFLVVGFSSEVSLGSDLVEEAFLVVLFLATSFSSEASSGLALLAEVFFVVGFLSEVSLGSDLVEEALLVVLFLVAGFSLEISLGTDSEIFLAISFFTADFSSLVSFDSTFVLSGLDSTVGSSSKSLFSISIFS